MDSDRCRGHGYWRDETKSIFFILPKGKLTHEILVGQGVRLRES